MCDKDDECSCVVPRGPECGSDQPEKHKGRGQSFLIKVVKSRSDGLF